MKSDEVTDRIKAMRITDREARSELIGPSASLWLDKRAEAESWALAEASMSGDTARIAAAAFDYHDKLESLEKRKKARNSSGAQLPEYCVPLIVLRLLELESDDQLTSKNFASQLRKVAKAECSKIDTPEGRTFLAALNDPEGRMRKRAELYDRICRHFYDEAIAHFARIEPALLDVELDED